MNTLDLTGFCKTKAQAVDFVTRLSLIAQRIYETNFNLEHELMETFGIQKKDQFMIMLHDNTISTEAPAALNEFFARVQQAD